MIVFDDGALQDLEEVGFSLEVDTGWAERQLEAIRSAVTILSEHPRIGRALPGSEIRELVISAGKSGFIALYQYDEAEDLVRVLAVRHQREAGYRGR